MLGSSGRLDPGRSSFDEALARCTFASFSRDGSPFFVRPLRPSDRSLEQEFIASLSESTRYMLAPLRHLSSELLDRFMDVNGDARAALIATARRRDGSEYIVGVARYALTEEAGTAEIAVTVTDAWQRRGIATLLLDALQRLAWERGIHCFIGWVSPENAPMRLFTRRAGFHVSVASGDQVLRIEKQLETP